MLDNFQINGCNAIVYEWWSGVPVADIIDELPPHAQKKCVMEVGKLLALIAGSLSPTDIRECTFWHRPGFTSFDYYLWHDYLWSLIVKWQGRIVFTEPDISSSLTKIIDDTIEAFRVLLEPKPICLLNCDYSYRNVLIDRKAIEILGVIDFELALIGDPLYDVASVTWRMNDDNDHREIFIDAWKQVMNIEVDECRLWIYEGIKAISGMAWIDKQGDRAQEHAAFRVMAVYHLLSFEQLSGR